MLMDLWCPCVDLPRWCVLSQLLAEQDPVRRAVCWLLPPSSLPSPGTEPLAHPILARDGRVSWGQTNASTAAKPGGSQVVSLLHSPGPLWLLPFSQKSRERVLLSQACVSTGVLAAHSA